MIEFPKHIITALGLVPVMNDLYDKGVLSVGHGTSEVQMNGKAFHKAFKTWFMEDRPDEYVEHHHILFGTDFFCLVKKEDDNG